MAETNLTDMGSPREWLEHVAESGAQPDCHHADEVLRHIDAQSERITKLVEVLKDAGQCADEAMDRQDGRSPWMDYIQRSLARALTEGK
jgi:hypothetical protein